ncbi:zinc finger protein 260-like isoform X2 [Colias croceus]|uniref:zinc finger protein 260-like isoform X2 n=1 Tax=Colias crocea TaxID=72248 RepID=UPI001E27B9B5|nr:zinc finger protein 260-like isoform X2 [Colias croceus]
MTDNTQMSKLEDLCRLCLEGPGCVDIFKTYLLPQNIQSCTGVEVEQTDKLPKTVCKTCFDIVNRAHRLRLTAAANDKHLKALLNTINYLENISPQQKENSAETTSTEGNVCLKKVKKDDETKDYNNVRLEQQSNEPPSKIIRVRSDLFENKNIGGVEQITDAKSNNQYLNSHRKKHLHHYEEEFNKFRRDSNLQYKEMRRNSTLPPKTVQESKSPKVSKESEEDDPLECKTCGKTFLTRKKLYLHDRLHNKTHECTIKDCGKKFATKGDLQKHIRTHTGEKPYMCCICKKQFAQGGTLKTHLETVHKVCKVEISAPFGEGSVEASIFQVIG